MHYLLALLLVCPCTWAQPINVCELFNHAYTESCIGNTAAAIHDYQTILTYYPNIIQVHHNLGYVLRVHGDLEGSISEYQKALALDPSYKAAQFGLATTLLYQGNFKEGWSNYCKEQLKSGNFHIDLLQTWAHNHLLTGKRLLLEHQGGLGDTMMFLRYVVELKQQGVFTILLVPHALKPLLSTCSFIDKLVTAGELPPAFDEHITLMGLPLLFPEFGNSIPTPIPYLSARQDLLDAWHKFFVLHTAPETFNVGLCWTADLKNDESRPLVAHRSIPLEQLSSLGTCTMVNFYSLQKDFTGTSSPFTITSFGPDLDTTHGSFMDTAAIMLNLDLVITVDTSIAHLAGALGVPVWLMLPYNVDWRWTAHRTDSPWYPTMRIFRQKVPLSWESVVTEIVVALQKEVRMKQKKEKTCTQKNFSSPYYYHSTQL
jgi:hypothetical protein